MENLNNTDAIKFLENLNNTDATDTLIKNDLLEYLNCFKESDLSVAISGLYSELKDDEDNLDYTKDCIDLFCINYFGMENKFVSLFKLKLINHIAENLLQINNNDSAFSLTVDNNSVSIILNDIDTELLVINTFVKLLNDYILINELNVSYHISVNKINDCKEIIFDIS